MSANRGQAGTQKLRPAARYLGAGLLALLGIPVSVGFAPSAFAAEWYARPSVKARSEFNDNILLTTQPHDNVWGAILDVGSEVGVRTERSGFSATPRLRFSRYPGEKSLNSDDQFVPFTGYHDTERDRFQVDGTYQHDTTLVRGDTEELASELELSGVVQQRVRRNVFELIPSWTRALTERMSLRIGSNYQKVDYDQAADSGLVDFDYAVLDTALTYSLTERDKVSATPFTSRFRAFGIGGSKTTSYGLLTRYDRQLSETINGYVGVGVQHNDSDFIQNGMEVDATNTTWLADAGLDGTLDKTAWEISFTRSASPTSGGDLVARNSVSGSITRRLTQRLNGTLVGYASSDTAIGESDTFSDRKLYRFIARLYYRLTERWSLAAAYRFTRQDRDSTPGSPQSNAVLMTIRYDDLGWSTSR